jgi:predicted phosphodiesterase
MLEMHGAYKSTIDQIDTLRNKMTDLTRDHYEPIGHTDNIATKVLVLTDIHAPFEHDDVIEYALRNDGDADILVIGGDFIEAHSVSSFRKSKALLFRWEYEIALEYIKLFSGMFKKVVLVSGNHERRLQRYVADNMGNMLHGLVQDDPLQSLADGMAYGSDGKLAKLYEFPNVIYEGYPRGDYQRIGKLVVAHPNNYSTVPLRTVVNTAEALLDIEDYQCLIMGHTHAQGHLIWRNRLLIEAGCCCIPLEYTFATGRMNKLPQTFGYAVAYLDKDGNVNFDKTRAVYRGVGRVIKPETLSAREMEE